VYLTCAEGTMSSKIIHAGTNHNIKKFAHRFEYANSSETQQMQATAGTLFGAYNAITGYYQNINEYKSNDHKLNSIMYGAALDRTKKAFDLCMNANEFLS
jgi:Domain of unknown function (DUF932)